MNAISGPPIGRTPRSTGPLAGRYRSKSALPGRAASNARPWPNPTFHPVGDTGISVQFGQEIDPVANDAVNALDHAIAAAELPGIVETVPSFRALLIVYEPEWVDRDALIGQLRNLLARATRARRQPPRHWTLPVAYDPLGEDLPELSALLGLSERAIVAAHTAAEFRVYMLGFQPGLPNLGGLPPELQISRRMTPRKPVPAGSVMIGGVQGAIMPLPTPTGLYMIGRSPVCLFDRRRAEPALLRAGDIVRFRPINPDEFTAIGNAVIAGDLNAGADLETLEAI